MKPEPLKMGLSGYVMVNKTQAEPVTLADKIATRAGLTSSKIDEIRAEMGTLPQMAPVKKTNFYRGVEGIQVHLIDRPANPYKAIFAITAATWGNVWKVKKWNGLSPEARFFVVKACLDGKSLPNGMEAVGYTFEIAGLSRAAFDQIARIRVGAVIGSMGVRDNNHSDADYRIPEAMWKSPMLAKIEKHLLDAKDAYAEYLEQGQGHWQDARALMPMSALHRFAMYMNYAAMRGFMGHRMKACEQADTVATAWLMREEVARVHPFLASYLRPSCDVARRCTYHDASTLSEAFSCLFKGCGRWPEADDGYATFNESCSDYPTMSRQAGFKVFDAEAKLIPERYENVAARDQALFEEEM
jgi:hypothetical protein